ncbi:unnamed protein product [Caenorhabditis auriculariae]|uniref:Coiled-coil domain-containing protein 130 n=1 Tax=Caenorhabditis auriculariae TaxID=2777116 RepID=A0A8S1GST0_9PELO|nr:unnamed protein product [Caenorhabditis auriculariae]
MGERKGQNFYYPPDFDYRKHKTLNGYHGTHALRERAKKIDQGILIIRFEMPFNVWCLGCHNHIGMGVRYNAEKKKVGMYYTTPLYEFRMKCHLCDNYLVIRTDPKNFDYELVEGCSRQEKRYDPSTIDQLGAVDRGFAQKLAADAMFKTEHVATDKNKGTSEESRVEKLEWIQERGRDDFSANQYLRAQFRKEKKHLGEQRAHDDSLRSRLSIPLMKLAPADPKDERVAAMLTRYRDIKAQDDVQEDIREEIGARRIFGEEPSTSSTAGVSTASDRLKASVRRERDRKINDQFSSSTPFASGAKRKASALGIVVKKAVKKEDVDVDVASTSEASLEDVKKEEEPSSSSGVSSIKLIADYGTSSDSD